MKLDCPCASAVANTFKTDDPLPVLEAGVLNADVPDADTDDK